MHDLTQTRINLTPAPIEELNQTRAQAEFSQSKPLTSQTIASSPNLQLQPVSSAPSHPQTDLDPARAPVNTPIKSSPLIIPDQEARSRENTHFPSCQAALCSAKGPHPSQASFLRASDCSQLSHSTRNSCNITNCNQTKGPHNLNLPPHPISTRGEGCLQVAWPHMALE